MNNRAKIVLILGTLYLLFEVGVQAKSTVSNRPGIKIRTVAHAGRNRLRFSVTIKNHTKETLCFLNSGLSGVRGLAGVKVAPAGIEDDFIQPVDTMTLSALNDGKTNSEVFRTLTSGQAFGQTYDVDFGRYIILLDGGSDWAAPIGQYLLEFGSIAFVCDRLTPNDLLDVYSNSFDANLSAEMNVANPVGKYFYITAKSEQFFFAPIGPPPDFILEVE